MFRILIIDDDPNICLFFETLLEKMDCETYTAKTINEAKALSRRNEFDIILLDCELPDGNGLDIMPDFVAQPSSPEIIIITGKGDARGAEIAFKNGAWDFVQKPFRLDDVSVPIQRALHYRKEKLSSPELIILKRSKIIGESAALKRCLDEVGKAASTDAGVLVTGETGTGKELFAKAIHENSRRASKPFVAVDCASLTESLIESTLFGHEKGAFTGATFKQDGLIIQADGGTLMLDEVGDLPLSIQKALLRTLQERSVRRLGGKKEIGVDIRLISATNLDLDQLVKENLFREDFLYRIRAMEIHLPPLRDRANDIEEIVLKKVHELSNRYNLEPKAISKQLLDALMSNSWPGNIRELLNVLEYILASAGSDPTLVPKHLPPNYRLSSLSFEEPDIQADAQSMVDEVLDSDADFPSLNACREQLEKNYLTRLMEKAGGDRKTACRLSGVSQARLYALLSKYDLPGFGSYQN
nr:sigma-54 dependent transcriptional regulator [uncultured Desulfobacter sp.]